MKIIRADGTGHTEVLCETVEETITQLEQLMNSAGYPASLIVETKPNETGVRINNPADLRTIEGITPDTQVWILPQLVGG